MRIVLFILILLQSFLFGDIQQIPFAQSAETYKNYKYTNLEFYTKNTYNIEHKFLGIIVSNFEIKQFNNQYQISLDIHNYSNLIGSLDVYDIEGKLIESHEIAPHSLPTTLVEGAIEFALDYSNFVTAYKYKSLDVARDPYKDSQILLTLPSKNYIIRISLASDEAFMFNFKKLFLDTIIEQVNNSLMNGLKVDNETIIEQFAKRDTLEAMKKILLNEDLTDDLIKSKLNTLIESSFEAIVTGNEAKAIKDPMDMIIGFSEKILIVQNQCKYKEQDINKILGSTIYISLSGINGNRGFWGLNNSNSIKEVWKKTEQVFRDIPLSSPFYTSTKNMFDKEVITGYNKGEYREYLPNNKINRAEFTKIIMNISNEYKCSEETTYNNPFSDVTDRKDQDWFASKVLCAYREGIIKGYPKEKCPTNQECFKPTQNITLAEAFKIVVKVLVDNPPIKSEAPSWWTPFLEKLGKIKYLENWIQTIAEKPDEYVNTTNLTRGEMAQLVYGICQSKDNKCKQ